MRKLKVVTEPLQIKSIHFDKVAPLYRVVMLVPPSATITINAFNSLAEGALPLSKIAGGLRLCSEEWGDKYPKDWLYFEAKSKEKPGCLNKDMDYAEFKTFKAGGMARLSALLQINTAKGIGEIKVEIRSMQLVDVEALKIA
jgi:hypothetical protein